MVKGSIEQSSWQLAAGHRRGETRSPCLARRPHPSLPAGLTSDWGLIRCVKIGANGATSEVTGSGQGIHAFAGVARDVFADERLGPGGLHWPPSPWAGTRPRCSRTTSTCSRPRHVAVIVLQVPTGLIGKGWCTAGPPSRCPGTPGDAGRPLGAAAAARPGERVRSDDPLQHGQAGAEIAANGRQRDAHHGRVDGGHRGSQNRRQQHPASPGRSCS